MWPVPYFPQTNAFALVFASMSPGVQDPETLEKVMQASRNFCYRSTFSGDGIFHQKQTICQGVMLWQVA